MELISWPVMAESLKHLHAAFRADCRQQYKEAVGKYMDGAPLLLQLAREEGLSMQVKQQLKSRCQQYLDRIQVIKTGLESEATDIPPNSVADRTQPISADNLDDESRKVIQNLTELPFHCAWDDVKGSAQAKEFLWANVVLPLLFPSLPGSVTRVKRGIMLYGLPGTGKTMMLCALAEAVACPVVRVTAIDLISRWTGDAERAVQTVKDLFTWAHGNQPCIVCVDDLEMLCHPDHDKEGSIARQVREELVLQLKPLSVENQVIVMAATQKPWYLGGTLRRRFDRRFHIPLPDSAERRQIFSKQLSGITHELTEDDFNTIAHLTSGFTGADISSLARSCAMEPVRIIQAATHYKKVTATLTRNGVKVTQEMLTPCAADAPGAVGLTWEYLNPERVLEPPITTATVRQEVNKTKPSCTDSDLQQMSSWSEEFGQE